MKSSKKSDIDWFIFIGGTVCLLSIVIPIVAAPKWSASIINVAFKTLTGSIGVIYVIAACVILGFLLWIAFGASGKLILGSPDGPPAHSRFSWAAMLFCTGIGSTLIYWSAVEWAFYFQDPPFGNEPHSDAAILWATSYGLFHWGPIAWGFYALPAVAFCCSYYLRNIPILRLSAACSAVLKNQVNRWPGRIVDLLFIVGLLGTAATGVALGASMVASAVTRLTGLPDGFGMQLVIIVVATSLIAFSVYRGLDKGIKVLSTINAVLALVLVTYVFIVGPSRFILEMSATSTGHLLQNFLTMMTWTDPLERSEFVENWTVFYWAWWLALGPFVGMFIAKISHGRTLREVIFGMLGWGSLGCAIFFFVLGNYALDLELTGRYAVAEQALNESPSAAIASIIELLPMGGFWLGYVSVLGLIFVATTYDSAAYSLAAGATRQLRSNEDPARAHRVYWAILLGFLPAVLLFLGGLKSVQTASVVASVPLLPIYVMLAWSTVRMLKAVKQ